MFRRWMTGARYGTARYWILLVVAVSRLGATPRDRLRILVTGLLLPSRDRWVPRDRWRPLRFSLRYRDRVLPWAVMGHTDLTVLNDVLVLGDYACEDLAAAATVVDLGSHVGSSILFFRDAAPNARIVGVEPDPGTFSLLERNVAALPDVSVRNVAVGGVDGETGFQSAPQGMESRLTSNGAMKVRVERLDTLLADLSLDQVDVLKIDIEGAEDEVVRGFSGLSRVGAIVGEFHGDAAGAETFFALFEDFELDVHGDGYEFFHFHARNRAR
jgi:FkbM family methyltransferase